MLLGDMGVGEWIGVIGGGIATITGALIAAYFLFRTKKTEADVADAEANRKTREATSALETKDRKEKMAVDAEALQRHIDDLRTYSNKLQDQIAIIQSQTLQKIIDAHDEHHECVRKYSELYEEHITMQNEFKTLQSAHAALEQRLREIEGKRT